MHFVDINTGWAVGEEGTILHTTDGGTSWNSQTSGTTYFLHSVHFTDNNTGWTVGGLYGDGIILHTSNGGETWSNQVSGIEFNLLSAHFVDNNTGWVVGTRPNIPGGSDGIILKTTNGGEDWLTKLVELERAYLSVYFINHNIGWVAAGFLVKKTTDGGDNWINYLNVSTYGGLESIFFINNNIGWAAGGIGNGAFGEIIKSTDGGENWDTQYTTEYQMISIFFVSDTTGWAVGKRGTILKTTNGGVTFIEDDNTIPSQPTEFLLSQNYPNPFNPSTSIQYAVSSRQFVSLKVYDLLGREVATLVDEEKPAGNYEVEFNGADLTSGIYFYQLHAGSFVETRKMVLLR